GLTSIINYCNGIGSRCEICNPEHFIFNQGKNLISIFHNEAVNISCGSDFYRTICHLTAFCGSYLYHLPVRQGGNGQVDGFFDYAGAVQWISSLETYFKNPSFRQLISGELRFKCFALVDSFCCSSHQSKPFPAYGGVGTASHHFS